MTCLSHAWSSTTKIIPRAEIRKKNLSIVQVTVPLLRGGQAKHAPLTATCAPPPFWLTLNTTLETSRKDKTTDNDGKRNNYIQT